MIADCTLDDPAAWVQGLPDRGGRVMTLLSVLLAVLALVAFGPILLLGVIPSPSSGWAS